MEASMSTASNVTPRGRDIYFVATFKHYSFYNNFSWQPHSCSEQPNYFGIFNQNKTCQNLIINLKCRIYYRERAGIFHGMPTLASMMPALGQASIHYAHPRASIYVVKYAIGLPRPSAYCSRQAAGGALGAGIFARIPRPAMSFCSKRHLKWNDVGW